MALAFRDSAFSSRHYRTPEDLWRTKIPARLLGVPITWADEWACRPICRKTVYTRDGVRATSPDEASQYAQMQTWLLRLGRSFGLPRPFEYRALRRSAAIALNSKSGALPCVYTAEISLREGSQVHLEANHGSCQRL